MDHPVSTIAKLFNLTERRVQQLAKDNVIPKATKGKYDLVGCVQGYIKFLQERAFSKDIETGDYRTETIRVKKLTADKLQIELEQLRGNLLPADVVVSTWQSLISNMRAKMLSLPAKLAQVWPSAIDATQAEELARGQVYEALEEIASDGLPDSAAKDSPLRGPKSSSSGDAPAKSNGKRVGKPKKKTKPRVKRRTRAVSNKQGAVSKRNTR